ncbi:MAG TPA: protein kinase, partial [Pyrinomonadaceae bacterium]|nr:protein kinase [Pyrinomonadaceae bacterium]
GKSTTASDKNSSQIQNPDFHESKPDEPAGFSGSRVSGFENSEANAEAEKPISKPDTELEPAESYCPPPMFDSVRIMEKPSLNDKEKSDGEKAGDLHSVGLAQEDSVLVIQNPHSTKVEQGNANRSFTTPNIAITETDGKKSAKLKPLDEGTVLNGRYEIVRKIGGGGMGAVYLASDKNLGGVLRAVKEMVQSYIEDAQQEKAVSDFKRESLLLTSLEHQAIPTIYDYFFDDKEARFYLVMKYISGGDLASRLRSASEGRIEEKIVTEWAIQIADVLDYLHNRQPAIIYRDLKPANIMVDGGNSSRVMLIDFGIARWVNKEEKGVTAVGTMGYAPPELFSGNVEPRSDIYSLGSTLFHLLTGADPQSNPLLIFDFQKHPRPRQINPQISDQMEKILMRAVEYSADKRFASAAELREALVKHLENLKANKVTFGVKETPSPAAFADQPVFCGFCGQKIVATDMFCAFCGAKQPLAHKGVHLHDRSPERFTAQLLIVGTNELKTPSFLLEKNENLVGRRDPVSNIFPEIDLSKFDPQTKISRKHARIWREGTNFLVEDLGSSNGTIVLPVVKETVRLLPHQPFALNNGDKIKLGDTTLHFVVA